VRAGLPPKLNVAKALLLVFQTNRQLKLTAMDNKPSNSMVFILKFISIKNG
jgi:hypothetical protein